MDFFYLFMIFVFVELFESNWQKSQTLHDLILKNFSLYKTNIFLYFVCHISFFYTIFLALTFNNFSFLMSSIVIIKFLDITFKLSMMKKLYNGLLIEEVMPMNIKMTLLYRYMNVIIYPITFLFAIGFIQL